MRKLLAIILFGMIMFVQLSQAQETKDYKNYPYWSEMMQEPEANFAEVQKAFYTYWEGREITKGCGYKPFKRWEHFWKPRLSAEGKLPAPGYLWDVYHSTLHNRDSEQGNWTNLGPIAKPDINDTGQPNGNGRINAIGFHPTNENIFYVGTPAGGLWTTLDGGATWTTNTDNLPSLGVSSIIVDYDNPDVMYIGTGDRDAYDAPGVGVLKSINGGETWESANTGMDNVIVGRMIMHPTNNQILLAATSNGIYLTSDAGANWAKKENGNFKEIIYHPTNAEIVYATSNGSFYKSVNGGETWTSGAQGYGGGNRAVIGVSAAAPDYVYILTSNSQNGFKALYRSTDAGDNFTTRSTSPNILEWSCNGSSSGGQGWYDLEIAVDPNNAEIIYSGGVNIWKSTDGGVNWDIRAHWVGDCGVAAVHADHHVFEYNPLNNRMYDGNDGGLYWTADGGVNWTEITSGIANSQIYKLGQSRTVRDYVITGYQDNGTGVFEGAEEGWATILGGDGMDCLVDWEDATFAYGELYYGAIRRFRYSYMDDNITGDIPESGNWVTPFILHEGDPNTMFVGMNNVWRTRNVKDNAWAINWDKISNFSGEKVSVLEHSPADLDILYLAKDNALIKSENVSSDTPNWEGISGLGAGSSTINDIEAHPFLSNVVYVAKGQSVFMSDDKGDNWTDITDNLPASTVSTIEYYQGSFGGLYAGTDLGIYYRDAAMNEWVNFSNGYPMTAATTDLEIFYDPNTPAEDVIRVSTYGRGTWESPVYVGMPVADFSSDVSEVAAGCTVDFFDKSTGTPYEYNWTFEGAEPAVSNEQSPKGISFLTPGQYSVTLTVTNPNGSDTKTIAQMITVLEGQAPEVDFFADHRSFCNENYTTTFHDLSSYCPTSWEWTFDPNSVEFLDGTNANSQNPVVRFLDETSYTVSLTSGNNAGSNSLTYEDYISTVGFSLPYSENFSNGFDYNDWLINNPDSKGTWEITEIDGNKMAMMSFFNYNSSPGDKDELISPVLDFSDMERVYLHFRHAYKQRVEQWKDSLNVFISSNCDTNWTNVLALGEDGSGSFATAAPSGEEFFPTSDDEWCGGSYSSACNTVDLSAFAGQKKIMIKFQTKNNNGNNLFIDDIVINNTIGVEDLTDDNPAFDFRLYPNPADKVFHVVVNDVKKNMVLELSNIHGQLLMTKPVNTSDGTYHEQIPIGAIKAGVYLVTLKSEKSVITKKLVIN